MVALLTSTLTLASFLKFLGVGFLGRRSGAVVAAAARGRLEVGPSMLLPQLFLAALCVLLGLVPALAARAGASVLAGSPGGLGSALAGVGFATGDAATGLEVLGGSALLRPLTVLLLLGVLFLLARALARAAGAPRRVSPPWLCGYAHDGDGHGDRYRYSTHDLYGEVKVAFRFLGGAVKRKHPTGSHGEGR